MISEELLSEVLDKKITYIEDKSSKLYQYLNYNVPVAPRDAQDGAEGKCTINIHELSHKCKEWAFDKHKYFLSSGKDIEGWWCRDRSSTDNNWLAKTEPEAIFQACEWILVSTDTKSLEQD